MADEHGSTCAPRLVSRELLATPEAELAADLSTAIAQACASTSWVRAAYVSRARHTYEDGAVREPLATFVIPDPPENEPHDRAAESRTLGVVARSDVRRRD